MEWNNTLKVLNDAGRYAVAKFQDKLMAPDPIYNSVATGSLLRGVKYEIITTNIMVGLFFVFPDDAVDKRTNLLYIEQGRAPGKYAPREAIKQWIIDRKITLGGVYSISARGSINNNLDQAAYLINRHIKNFGIRPKPYVEEVRQELLNSNFIQEIKDAMRQDAIDFIKKI